MLKMRDRNKQLINTRFLYGNYQKKFINNSYAGNKDKNKSHQTFT